KGRALTASGSFRYDRPQLAYDRTMFTDLVQYAPGPHNTLADIYATLEQEAEIELPMPGSIDGDARGLIARARSAGWPALTIPAEGPLPSYKIYYSGVGQFAYERMLVSGLREQVVCDGKTLWHLYPEIGLAAKRPFSRHHYGLITAIAPAFLPAAEELARGYDVKARDATTIALVPLWAGELKKDEKYTRVHLVFANDGRLSEHRFVEMPAGKAVLRQLLQADGTIEWLDGDGKSLAKQTRTVAPAQAPNLQPSVGELVVMTMPIRTRNYWLDRWRGDEKDYFVEQCLVSECITHSNSVSAMMHFGRFFHAKGDRRLGFYTLMNAGGFQIANENLPPIEGQAWSIDIEKEHPQNALAMFLAQE